MRDMITIWPGVYHSGINTGWSFNEAVNFGKGIGWRQINCAMCPGENTVVGLDLDGIEPRI